MSFLRNFRNNIIQHQSNKVHYKDTRSQRPEPKEESDEEKTPIKFDTYTRTNRKSSNYNDNNQKTSSNYSTLRSENVVRVYLNSPSSPVSDRRRSNQEIEEDNDSRKISRSETFTKADRPTIVRSDTFTLKSESNNGKEEENVYEEYENQKSNYSTFTRSNKDSKSRSTDKSGNYSVDSGTYKKDKNRNNNNKLSINTNTFTKPVKPKRVESLIKRFERNFLRREKEPKEASPTPSAHSTESQRNQKSKNIFNLIGGHKTRTRDVGINCKIDEDLEYQKVLSTKRMTLKPAISERTLRSARKLNHDSKDSIRAAERRISKGNMPEVDQHIYENLKKNARPAPLRVEIDLRRATKYEPDYSESAKPVGIANPQVQRTSNTSTASTESRRTTTQKYQVSQPIRVEIPKSKPSPAPRTQPHLEPDNFSNRKAPEKMSFREYRESLRAKRERNLTSDPEDDLKKTYQQSFFVAF